MLQLLAAAAVVDPDHNDGPDGENGGDGGAEDEVEGLGEFEGESGNDDGGYEEQDYDDGDEDCSFVLHLSV